MTTHNTSKETGAVICAGLFIVVSGNTATAHILMPEDVASVYSRMAMAIACRNVETAMQQATRLSFHVKDADFCLPADEKSKLETLFETYNGPAKDDVRRIAASWLGGVPFTSFDDNGKGAADRIPEPPTPPPTPAAGSEPELKPEPDNLSWDGLLALCKA